MGGQFFEIFHVEKCLYFIFSFDLVFKVENNFPQNFEDIVPMVPNVEDILTSILCMKTAFLSSLEASRIFSFPSEF